MSLLAQRRAFLASYRQTGSIEAAAAEQGIDPSVHDEWMKDWLYRGAFVQVEADRKAGVTPEREKPKKKMGRPPKPRPENPPPKRPRGRPPKNPPPVAVPEPEPEPVEAGGSQHEPPAESPEAAPGSPGEPPVMVAHTFPGDKGYVRLFVAEGEPAPAAPVEPERPKRQVQEPTPEPVLDLTLAADDVQRALLDELGELDRRRQIYAADDARFEMLKKAVKNWCVGFPADADVVMQGDRYLIRVSCCERERRIRDMREVVERIGIDRVLQIATVPINELQKLMGSSELDALLIETRSGSRRVRCVPRFPAVPPT